MFGLKIGPVRAPAPVQRGRIRASRANPTAHVRAQAIRQETPEEAYQRYVSWGCNFIGARFCAHPTLSTPYLARGKGFDSLGCVYQKLGKVMLALHCLL